MSESTPLEKDFPESSNVLYCKYDHAQQQLEVTYRKGDIYLYHAVPLEIWRDLLRAESIGKFLNTFVVRAFAHSKPEEA
jgi:hypothetical protein